MSKRMMINLLAVLVILLGGMSYGVAGGFTLMQKKIHISACSGGGTDCYCDGVCHVGSTTCYCADY